MNKFSCIFLFLLSLFLNGCTETGRLISGESDSGLSTFEKARRIEQTLLMSDLLVSGYIVGLKNTMAMRAMLDNKVEACIKRKGGRVISHAFTTAIVETLSESEINDGFHKSENLVFEKANAYILDNIEFLSREYAASDKKSYASDFFLLTASEQLGLSDLENQSILEFVSWRQNSGLNGISSNRRLEHSLLKSDLLQVLQDCT